MEDLPTATYEIPQGRVLPLLITVLFILGILYSLFLFFDRLRLNRSIAHLKARQVEVQRELSVLQDQNLQALFLAQETREKFETSFVPWSSVIRDLQRLTPVGVFLNSYGLSEGGSIQISGLGDGFGSVADLIAALNASKVFKDVFVPTLTLGTAPDGQPIASFNIHLQRVASLP